MDLFGMVAAQASVLDLGVIDASVVGSDTSEHVAVLAALNKGTIARCAVTGTVAGDERVGGLAGQNDGQISDCYASGEVTGKSAPPAAYPTMGGLVGDASSSSPIVSSYFLGRNNSLGTQLSEEQMKERGSFVGWDFVGETANGAGDIWWILEGQDYPRLQWEQAEAGQ
jgi:hypothetical protein